MATWSEGSEDDDLVKELLDDGSPLLVLPQEAIQPPITNASSSDHAFNRFLSNIYSGPTISDIENALSLNNQRDHFPPLSSPSRYKCFQTSLHYFLWLTFTFGACLVDVSCFFFRVSILEKGLSKIENKYTLKIKCFGNGMGDDGYKWRKYGQKSIKNSPNPR